mmetsp:Transcript_27768/g.59366  ORF Transcript_27768/g.59366 Transcript_27768/m.59366 type:complete len:112 (+) Transcript_27768:272-607(+)
MDPSGACSVLGDRIATNNPDRSSSTAIDCSPYTLEKVLPVSNASPSRQRNHWVQQNANQTKQIFVPKSRAALIYRCVRPRPDPFLFPVFFRTTAEGSRTALTRNHLMIAFG